jgi:hypothetical protein
MTRKPKHLRVSSLVQKYSIPIKASNPLANLKTCESPKMSTTTKSRTLQASKLRNMENASPIMFKETYLDQPLFKTEKWKQQSPD